MAEIEYRLSPPLGNEALNGLFAAAWHTTDGIDFQPVLQTCLCHVCAYDGERLAGFINVAWDGAFHAFLLNPTVHPDYQRRGVGRELVARAVEAARAAGCDWLHVDYASGLRSFYEACGFEPAAAGVMRLDQGAT
jgi:GNAT superfamily N-acetyltransferase